MYLIFTRHQIFVTFMIYWSKFKIGDFWRKNENKCLRFGCYIRHTQFFNSQLFFKFFNSGKLAKSKIKISFIHPGTQYNMHRNAEHLGPVHALFGPSYISKSKQCTNKFEFYKLNSFTDLSLLYWCGSINKAYLL